MNEQNELFLPEQIDEQIEALMQSAPFPTPPARLISNLRVIYQEDQAIVEQVRARLDRQLTGRRLHDVKKNGTLYEPPIPSKGAQPMQTPPPGPSYNAEQFSQERPALPARPENPGYWERSARSGIIEQRPEQPRPQRRLFLPALIAAALIIIALFGGTTFLLANRTQTNVISHVASPTPAINTPRSQTATVSSPVPPPAPAKGLYITTQISVARVDLQSGQTLWQVPASFSAQPVVIGNIVIISSTPANGLTDAAFIEGLAASNGKVLWRFNAQASYLQGAAGLRPGLNGGIVYASGCTAHQRISCAVQALDAASGALLWSYQTLEGTAWITLSQNSVIYGATATNLFELSTNGQLLWQTTLPADTQEQITSAPVVSENRLYVTTCINPATAPRPRCSLNAFTGSGTAATPLWKIALIGQAVASPTVAAGTVYVSTQDGHILTMDTSQGPTRIVGTYQLAGQITKPLVFMNSLLYAEIKPNSNASGTRLVVIDTTNWQTRWSQDLGKVYGTGPDWQTMTVFQGELYAVNGQNTISVLRATDGNTVYTYHLASTSSIVAFAVAE